MKIAINALSAQFGGGISVMRTLLPRLVEAGKMHTYVVFYSSRQRSIRESLPQTCVGVELHHVPKNAFARVVWEQLVLPWYLFVHRIDVLYSTGNTTILLAPCKVVLLIENANPYSRARLEWSPKERLRNILLRALGFLSAQRASIIRFVSENSKQLILPQLLVPQSRAVVIPHGVDLVRCSQVSEPAPLISEKYILTVGANAPHRNILRLFEAFALLVREHDYAGSLIVVGNITSSTYGEKIRATVERLELGARVQFTGEISHQTVSDYFRKTDVFIFPSIEETFGIPLIEAMGFGAPMVVADCSLGSVPQEKFFNPFKEICQNAALYCDPFDPQDMARTLQKVLTDAVARHALIAAGKTRVRLYDVQNTAHALTQLFEQLDRERINTRGLIPSSLILRLSDASFMALETGNFIAHTTCRCCESSNMVQVMDFGRMPLAGGFLKRDQFATEQLYPLTIAFCSDCTLLQVVEGIPPATLFKDYFYFSSAIKTLVDHCTAWAQEAYDRFLKDKTNTSVFEIGCNDGVMLKPFAALGVKAIGVDPATNVVNSVKQEGFTIINDFFNEAVADRVVAEHGKFDVVTSSYSFAHIDEMVGVGKGLAKLLKDDGVFMCEVYYLGTLMEEMQYDMIYHEHCNYYSLKALQNFFGRHGLEIFDVKFTPGVRSGAVRFFARKINGSRTEAISEAVKQMERDEVAKGYHAAETFKQYGEKIAQTKTDLLKTLDELKAQGKTIIGYGASGRGTMIMNYCGIDGRYLDYVVDDAPAKHGFFTPGTHVEIFPWDHTVAGKFPDYALLFAWSFMNEVLKKRVEYTDKGGKFIVPLPTVQIVP